MDQEIYDMSIVAHYLDGAGVKRQSKDNGRIKKLQEAYDINHASCIGSLIHWPMVEPKIISGLEVDVYDICERWFGGEQARVWGELDRDSDIFSNED
jgi:hypothetical protein